MADLHSWRRQFFSNRQFLLIWMTMRAGRKQRIRRTAVLFY
jgi:hypothetical protein